MKDLKYNYVVFNVFDNVQRAAPNGYYTICTKDLEDKDGIQCINYPLSHLPYAIRFLYNLHNTKKVNRFVNIPLKNLWYPYIFKNKFKNNKPICFVCLQRLPISYLNYLKKHNPDSRFVLIYRDLRKITEILTPEHIDNPIYDLSFTIDKNEANKYGYIHFDEFESKIEIEKSKDYPISDVFFAGKAKDRLPKLLQIYDTLTDAGLKVSFYITHAPISERVERPGIEYADKFIPYSEMLYRTVNSKCVLEINQEEAIGYTSRFLEAVMFNKRLVTDNLLIKGTKFYSTGNILCIENPSDISIDFIKDESVVDYNYQNEFSPINTIKLIDSELRKYDER